MRSHGMRSQENRRLSKLALMLLLKTLPQGQQRVAGALVDGSRARTYRGVATLLGLHLGTVHQHLRRIRLRHPDVYAALMLRRAHQLTERHARAVQRAESHSQEWHRRQANRRLFYALGRWPWEK